MRRTTRLLAFVAVLAASGNAISKPLYPGGIGDRRQWVELRDTNNIVQGSLRIVGSGPNAIVQFRDAEGVVLEAPFGKALSGPADQSSPLSLEPDPLDEKTDTRNDIELLKSQIATLQRNVKALQARLNGN